MTSHTPAHYHDITSAGWPSRELPPDPAPRRLHSLPRAGLPRQTCLPSPPCRVRFWRQVWPSTPARAPEQGTAPPHGRRGHLPRPRRHHPPRRHCAHGTKRRMGRIPPLHGVPTSSPKSAPRQLTTTARRRCMPSSRSAPNINHGSTRCRLLHHDHGRGPCAVSLRSRVRLKPGIRCSRTTPSYPQAAGD